MYKKILSLPEKVRIFFLFLFFSLVAYRVIIFTPGVIGHNWDWSIPYFPEYLQHVVKFSFYTWRNLSFGQSNILWLPQGPFVGLIMLPGFIGVTGDYISKAFVLFASVLSGYFMYLLLKDLLFKEDEGNWKFPAFLGSFFYAFSPFLFAELIGGAMTQILSYCFAPLAIFFLRKTLAARSAANIFFSVLLLSILTTSLQTLGLISFLFLVYGLFQANKKRYFLNFLIIYLVYFIFNLYWIIPTLAGIGAEMNYAVLKPEFTNFDNVNYSVPFLREIFVGSGYFRPLFTDTISDKVLPFWYLFTYFLISGILVINFFNKKSKEVLFWLSVFLLSLIFATGGKEPLGNLVIWLYQNFPLMSLFRSPQHFILLPTLAISVLIAFSALFMSRFKSFKQKSSKLFFLFFVFVWIFPFFTTGDIGSSILAQKGKDHTDVYRLSPGYKDIFSYLFSDKSNPRLLYLPMAGSVNFLANEFQKTSQGGDPLVAYSPFDTVNTDISFYGHAQGYGKILEEILCRMEDPVSAKKLIDLGGFKYLLLRSDVTSGFSSCKYGWDAVKEESFLNQMTGLKLIRSYPEVNLYENTNPAPHLYAASSIVDSNNTAQSLLAALSLGKINNREEILGEKKGNGWLEQLEGQPDIDEFHQRDQNSFDFYLDQDGKYEFWMRQNALENKSLELTINSAPKNLNLITQKGNWYYYGEIDLKAGNNQLQLVLPLKENLLKEEGKTLILKTNSGSATREFSLKVNNLSSIRVAFEYQTDPSFINTSLPPRYALYQDTDEVKNGGKISRLSSWLIKDTNWRQSDATLTLNYFTKNLDLIFYADKPDNGQTVISYKNFKMEEVFKNPVVLTSVKKEKEPATELPELIWKKINPTKYQVTVKKSLSPFYLVFLDSYDPKWQAFVKNKDSRPEKLIDDKNHLLVNSFANAWLVEEKGDYEIILEYWPQKTLVISSILSLGAILLTLIYLAFVKLTKK